MQQEELFETYELKGWNWSTRLYQILGVAVILNVVGFVLMAQANFLTGKTCDSPIASGVCSVLDALYVGGSILDADGNFVSKDYEPTEIGDSDVTFIEVSEPFTYPVGYFALANPEQQLDPDQIIASPDLTGVTTTPTDTGNLINTPQVLPPDNGSVLDEPLTGPLGTVTQGKTRDKKPKPPKTNDEMADTKDQKKISEPVKREINRKPFDDQGDKINEKLANNALDLSKNFEVVMEGTINGEGKLDSKKTKFVKTGGDEAMVETAKSMLEAMGDSGFYGYLKDEGIEKINITLVQDDNEIYVILLSEVKSAERASTTASGLNSSMQGLMLLHNNGLKKLDEATKIFLDNTKVTNVGKNVRLDFKLPKQEGLAIIKQTLEKREAKRKEAGI